MEVVKFILPFFHVPENYSQLLKKLAVITFYETYVITFFLRGIPAVNSALRALEHYGFLGVTLSTLIPHYDVYNVAGAFFAFAAAVVSHVFQLHNQVAKLLGIRRRFELKHLLFPLAVNVGAGLSDEKRSAIRAQRKSLMHDLFYRYASSRDAHPLVDRHDIEHALGAWSWYWVFLEGILYLSAAAAISYWQNASAIGNGFAIAAMIYFVLLVIQRVRLNAYAIPQIERIASDPSASRHVRQTFDAL